MAKYVQFALILVVCIALDQWTKQVASDRLATTHSWIEHPMRLLVPESANGNTLEEFLAAELAWSKPDAVREVAIRHTFDGDKRKLTTDSVVTTDMEIVIRRRDIVVIPEYFDFEYTRNPGAAFGVLSDTDSPWRMPFFIVISIVALGVILMMMRGVDRSDQLSIWALSLIAGGAVGNFIDRVLYGWVIDFIVWKYTDDYRWPTFNIADAFISVGVALLVIVMIRDWLRERRAESQAPASG